MQCIEPAVRSELLDEQLSELLQGYALPNDWTDEIHRLIDEAERGEKIGVDSKVDDLREQVAHLSGKLQRLLDSFLDGVIERETYVAKKAELMSEKKSLEEKMSDFTLGQIDWVEPMKNWLEKVRAICKIAQSADLNAKSRCSTKSTG